MTSCLLVLGAGGFIGSHVRAAISRRSGATRAVYASARPAEGDGEWHQIDLSTAGRDDLLAVIRDITPDVVVNCSGVTTGDAIDLVRGNVVLVADLLAAISDGAPGCRLVHLGSAAEYGAPVSRAPIPEEHPARPVGAYGVTKLAASALVLAAGAHGAVRPLVLRLFNPVGAGMRTDTLLGRAIAAISEAKRDRLDRIALGPLDAYRDFVAADDVADAILAAALLPEDSFESRVVNVGSGRASQARELIRTLARVAGYEGTIDEVGGASDRSTEVPWQQADITLAGTLLRWTPTRSLEDAVKAAWRAQVEARQAAPAGGPRADG